MLDTTASHALGFQPTGSALELLRHEVRWLADEFHFAGQPPTPWGG
ncbi:hypothetical protein [Cellulomonas bogoriensis]|nr:hypothetical protein [Cellulomonas bogoriensis]